MAQPQLTLAVGQGADGSTQKAEQIYRDCKTAATYAGTTEIQRFIIARQVFGKGYTG